MATTGGLAFATTMRMVDGVHGHTTGLRADALPAVTTGLTDLDELVLGVANFTNGAAAIDRDTTHFGAGQTQGGVIAFLGDELDAHACTTTHLAAATWLQLDVMDDGTDGDETQGKCVARTDVGTLTALEDVTDTDASMFLGRQQNTLFAK